MVRYDEALAGDRDARDWLLSYNEGDVRATLALREWMETADIAALPDLWESL